jgi:hypothetical protein
MEEILPVTDPFCVERGRVVGWAVSGDDHAATVKQDARNKVVTVRIIRRCMVCPS